MTQFFDIKPKNKYPEPQQGIDNIQISNNPENNIIASQNNTPGFKKYYFTIIILVIILVSAITLLTSKPKNNSSSTINDSKSESTGSVKSFKASSDSASPELPDAENANQNSAGSFSSNNSGDLNKTKITIEVLNGNGKTGAAQEVKTLLEKEGFIVASTGNADNYYNSTVIYYKTGKKESANLIAQALANYQVSFEENNDISKELDIQIVIGKK